MGTTGTCTLSTSVASAHSIKNCIFSLGMSTLVLIDPAALVSFVIPLRCRFEASLSQGCVAMAPRQSPGSKEEGEALKSECQSGVALSNLLQAVAKVYTAILSPIIYTTIVLAAECSSILDDMSAAMHIRPVQ